MSFRFQLRRGTAAQWTTRNPILADGEEGYEKDTGKRKVGDGATPWNSLPYNSAPDDSTEATTRAAADAVEAAARAAADSAETAARLAADTAEATARAAADAADVARDTAETTARQAAEAALAGGLALKADATAVTRTALEPILYDKQYGWELQPGSNVMATTLYPGVLVGNRSSDDTPVYACLVTVPAEASSGNSWGLVEADTPWTADDLNDASGPEPVAANTPYVAIWIDTAAPAPLPPGWAPVDQPKYLGVVDDGYTYFGGLVTVAADATDPSGRWSLAPLDHARTAQALYDSLVTIAVDGAPAGDYYASWGSSGTDGSPVPSWAEGFTSLEAPYGIGPVAITDENAGCLIDDIAYVVSGYIYNSGNDPVYLAAVQPGWIGVLPPGIHNVGVGDVFRDTINTWTVTGAGTVIIAAEGYLDGGTADAFPGVNPGSPASVYTWPFIERYDLATKTWLPRIPMPMVAGVYNAEEAGPEGPVIAGISNGSWTGNAQNTGYTAHAGVSPTNGLSNPANGSWGIAVFPADSTGPVEWEQEPYFWISKDSSGVLAISGDVDLIPEGATIWKLETANVDNALPDWEPVLLSGGGPYASEGGFAGVTGDKLYFGGGDGDFITGQEFFVFDPATGEFERLPDLLGPWYWPDYLPYGVVDGKLWYLTDGSSEGAPLGTGYVFDPSVGHFEQVAIDASAGLPNDQVQGVEIDGKLYFVYTEAHVFDPVALTMEVVNNTLPDNASFAWEVDGELRFVTAAGLVYALIDGECVQQNVSALVGVPFTIGEIAAVTYGDTPFALSAIADADGNNITGVYGLTSVRYIDSPPSLLAELAEQAADIDDRLNFPYALLFANGGAAAATFYVRLYATDPLPSWLALGEYSGQDGMPLFTEPGLYLIERAYAVFGEAGAVGVRCFASQGGQDDRGLLPDYTWVTLLDTLRVQDGATPETPAGTLLYVTGVGGPVSVSGGSYVRITKLK